MILYFIKPILSKIYFSKNIAPQKMIENSSNSLIELLIALLIVICALFLTQLLKREFQLPKIIGYLFAGLLIGPSGLGLLSKGSSVTIAPIIDILIGIVFYELGRRVNIRWLWRQKKTLLSCLILMGALFLVQLIYLISVGFSPLIAGLVAAIVMSTSPAVVLQTIKENQGEGQLTENLITIVALGNIVAYIIYSIILSLIHFDQEIITTAVLLEPLQKISISIVMGWLLAGSVSKISNVVKPDIDHQHLIVMTALMIVIVVSGILKISVLTCLLVFGLSIKVESYKPNLHKDDLGIFSTLAYVLIFIFAGINIDIFSLKLGLISIALGVILLRLIIPFVWGMFFYNQLNISFKKAKLLSVSLTPLSGIAILMLHDVNEFYPDLSLQLNNLLVMVVLIMEFSGPFLTKWALLKSGEGRSNA